MPDMSELGFWRVEQIAKKLTKLTSQVKVPGLLGAILPVFRNCSPITRQKGPVGRAE